MKSFGLSCEDAQDKDDWRLKTKGKLTDPSFPGQYLMKWGVSVFLTPIKTPLTAFPYLQS